MSRVDGKKRSNMRDVARQAGVSVATVSRVLNGTARVSRQTHERVRNAVEALQFVPSPAARSITSGRSHMVGALVPTLAHEIFARFLNEMEEDLSNSGFSLVVATTDYDREKEFRRARDLLNLGVEALIVSGLDHAPEFHALTERHRVPVISTSLYDATAPMPTIGYNNVKAAQSAFSYLTDAGHRKIAVLSGPIGDNDRTRERLRGLHGLSPEIDVWETGQSIEEAISLGTSVLASRPEVTALLCLSDIIAHGALQACKRQGLRVPEHISVIGIDDLPSSAYTDPPLTSVHLPVGRMGRTAAQAMVQWIETGVGATPKEIESHIKVRASVASPRG